MRPTRQRLVRIAILTTMFVAYMAILGTAIRTWDESQRDLFLLGGFLIACIYFYTYWRFWRSDMKRVGTPDLWVRVFCYMYSVFFTLGTLFGLSLFGSHFD